MQNFTLEELRDLLSTVWYDTQGSHGDDRSHRLTKLSDKLEREISKAKREAVKR
jgi:hypothetical protein